MSVISITGLTHFYNKGTPFESVAIRDINLEIQKGELLAIIGHTGSGKSTLIQHFNGLLKPDKGVVKFNGSDIWENKNISERSDLMLAFVFNILNINFLKKRFTKI